MSRRGASLIFAFLLVGLADRASAQDADKITEKLYPKVIKSCVFVAVPTKDGHDIGSGCLIDADRRLVLTGLFDGNASDTALVEFPIVGKDGSVVSEKAPYLERVKNGSANKGKIVARDTFRGLALIRLDSLPDKTPALPLADKDPPAGARAWNLGGRGGETVPFLMSEGLVRTVGPRVLLIGADDDRRYPTVVTAKNPVSPDDLGAPLLDRHGSLIGVCAHAPKTAQVVNTFVAVSEVRAFLAEKKVMIKGDGPKEAPKK
jgi:S1-C subfamily serine protease